MTRDKMIVAILLVISVALIWSLSFILVNRSSLGASRSTGDLPSLLFSAATVAIFVYSVLFAALAAFGWYAIQSAARAETALNSRLDQMQNEMRERLLSAETA